MSNIKLTDLIKVNVGSLLNEGRVEDVKSRYFEKSHPGIDYLSERDPSGNNKYLAWMAKQSLHSIKSLRDTYGDDQRNIERYSTSWKINGTNKDSMLEAIIHFNDNTQRYVKKDINQYITINELVGATEVAKTNLSRKELKDQGGEKVYEDDNFILIHPKTHEASCKYGSNTRWCVTMRDHTGYFERYSINGPLFFLIDKRRMEPVSSPKYMEKTPDYYKVAIHYQPLFNGDYGQNTLNRVGDAIQYANKLSKEEFVGSGNRDIARIDYWNVQDKKVSEGTIKRYLGGPGRGQKERSESIIVNFKNAMEQYTKKVLGNFYDSKGEIEDHTQEIEELKEKLSKLQSHKRKLAGVVTHLEDYKYYAVRAQQQISNMDVDDVPHHEFFSDRFNVSTINDLDTKLSEIRSKFEDVSREEDELGDRKTTLENAGKKGFAFYDLKSNK